MPIPMQMHELDDQALAFVAGGCEDEDTDCSESDDTSDNTAKYLKIAAGTIVAGAVSGGLYKLWKGRPKNKAPAQPAARSSTASWPGYDRCDGFLTHQEWRLQTRRQEALRRQKAYNSQNPMPYS